MDRLKTIACAAAITSYGLFLIGIYVAGTVVRAWTEPRR
jgi:hypothetical protein